MAFNWSFASGDSQTAEVFESLLMLDAITDSTWDDLTYSVDSDDVHSIDKGEMLEGVIQKINTYKGGAKKGDTVTWYNASALTGGPVLGDANIAGTIAPISTYIESCSIDQARKAVSDNGRLSAQRMPVEFRKTGRRLLAQWIRQFMDETVNIVLAAENTFVNGYTCYTSNAFSTVMNTSLHAFTSADILYAGNATSNATAAQVPNQFTAQLITRVVLAAKQGPTTTNYIPVKPLRFKGSRSRYALIGDGNVERQLQYDPEWRQAVQSGTVRADSNRTITGSIGSYGEAEIICQTRAFRPVANCSYAMLLGADALNFVPVHEWKWIEDTVDHGFKNVIITAAMFGLTPTFFNAARRNAKLVPHYVRD